MMFRFLWLLGGWALALMTAPKVLAEGVGSKINICQESILEQYCKDDNFGKSDFSVQPALNRCMNEMLVCRRYGELSQKLLAAIDRNQGSLPPVQEYFLGSAIFRLHLLNRSEGTRCELARMAKEHLESFLINAKVKYSESGSFGSVGLRYIRDAINSLETLNKPNGCPESALSRRALTAIATEHALTTAEDIFRSIEIDDPFTAASRTDTIQEMMNQIFTTIQGFTSKASELEIGSKMLETELTANDSRLNGTIKAFGTELYDPADGSITFDESSGRLTMPDKSSKLESAKRKASTVTAAAGAMERAKEQGLEKMRTLLTKDGISSADAYNAIRVKYSSMGYAWAAEAAFQAEAVRQLLFDQKMNDLMRKSSQSLPDGNPTQVFAALKLDYYSRYKSVCGTLAGRNRWYCKR